MLNWLKKLIWREAVTSTTQTPNETRPPIQARQSPPAPPPSDGLWLPPGKAVTVAGYDIPGGMIYVGTHLPGSGRYAQADPCLINPELRVNKAKPDHQGTGLGYWPSYSEISPACRAAYLEWLAHGRRDPSVGLGYVFLFFYGLERRVLRDYKALPIDPSEELAQIAAEVERLLDIYGNKGSFGGYAFRFLEVCRALQNSKHLAATQPPLTQTGWGLPISLKVALGQMIAEGQPIPVDWMLSWYLHSEQARLRTPATRCAEEFRQLLSLRYQQRYGEGMVVKPNQRKLIIEYHPLSSGFFGGDLSELQINIGDLPDIATLSAPLNTLQTLIDDCTNALDPYSRWLGRNGETPEAKAALALLPPELVDGLEDDSIRQLKQWLVQTLGEQDFAVVPGEALLSQWDASAPLKLTKKESTTLAQGLDKLGFGIEPDVRFGGKPLKGDSRIVLFRLGNMAQAAPSQDYTAATLLLHLAASVASADGVDAAKQNHLEEHLESALHLSAAERVRLRAYLAWLLQEKLSLRGVKTKLSKMTSDERAGIADFLIGVAGADGTISAQEISMLTKIYPLLGFEADDVYSHIHQLSTSSPMPPATAPVTVRPASQTSTGFAIPAPPDVETPGAETEDVPQDASGFTLDLAAIQHKQAESAKVADLLGDLFEEEEPDAGSSSPGPALKSDVSIAGLDALHSQFLLAIAQQTSWNRDVLEAKADELGLMLDGALEVINDAAFDTCDDPLTDGEDPIELDPDVLQQLLP